MRQRQPAATLRWLVSAYAAALVLTSTQAAAAQDTIDRPVTIYVAGTAGGGIDLYARLVSRHIGRHIPGKPTVTVQLMPGAGGIRAANYLAEQAPRDGTAMTTFASGPILEPLIGARNPGYDMSRFTWIGAITKDIGLCISWGPTPFKTIDDVKKQQMVVAGTGAGSETDTWPIVLNDVLGTKFKLVTGYVGSQETILAIERGEAHGRCVFSLSALKIAKPDCCATRRSTSSFSPRSKRARSFPGHRRWSISSPSRRTASCSNCSLALISHDFQVSAGLGAGLCDADLGRIIRLYSINSKNTFHNAQTRPNAPNTAVIAPPITKGSNHFSSRSSKTIFPHF